MPINANDLADKIANLIGMWCPGHQIKIRVANDGDDYWDIMDIKITEYGRQELLKLIQSLRDERAD